MAPKLNSEFLKFRILNFWNPEFWIYDIINSEFYKFYGQDRQDDKHGQDGQDDQEDFKFSSSEVAGAGDKFWITLY